MERHRFSGFCEREPCDYDKEAWNGEPRKKGADMCNGRKTEKVVEGEA